MKNEILEKVLNARKNLIVEGDISSGKTTNILFKIVDQIIQKKESLLILDSKEEYINTYYRQLKENNYNILILNLRDMDKSEGWNPLEYPYHLYKGGNADKSQEYLDKIGKTIFYDGSNEDPFWSTAASDFFTGVTLGLFEDGKKNEINLNSVNHMFDGVAKKYGTSDYITEYFKQKGVTSKPYIFASPTFLAPNDTKGSILSVARQKLRLYVSREKLSQLMNKTTFHYEDILDRPTAIIVIARDDNKTFNAIAAMFLEQLYAILVDLKPKNKFHFILDNFDNIEKCNDLVDILESCISRNMKTYLVTRSVSELTNTYGNYLLKLCDSLSVENTTMKLTIGNIEEKVHTSFETIPINDGNVCYPTLNNNKIELFDLENQLQSMKNIDVDKAFDVDDLIKSIDKKITDIEAQEEKINIED